MYGWGLLMPSAFASLLAVSATVSTSLDCIVLEGEAALVQAVAAEISTQSPCREVRVTLHKEGDRIVLQQADGPKRHTSTPLVAAAIIESWTNATIIAHVLRGPPASPTIETRSLTPTARSKSTPEEKIAWGALVRLEGGLAEDTHVNGGILARGDLQLSAITPWLGARLGFLSSSVARDNGNTAGRTEGEVLAGIDVPLRAGGFVFSPGLAAGVGFTQTKRRNSACTGTSCPGLQGLLLQDTFTHVTIGPRVEIGLRVARKLVSQLAFDAGLVFGYAPLADRDGAVPTYAQTLPEEDQTAFALPTEARFTARLGLGLRWGVW